MTHIKIKKIEDKDIKVAINSPEHEIEEIKEEIHEMSFFDAVSAKASVMEMWDDKS
jgi:sRNA-binding carbon storage regulator CsrA